MAATSTVGTSEPLPESVASLAAAQGLGALRATFLPKRLGTGRVVGHIVFGLFGLLIIVPGLYFFWLLTTKYPNFSRKQAAKRLYLFEQGLIVSGDAGPTGCIRWDRVTVYQEITKTYVNGVYVGTTYLYTLTNPDGTAVELTNFFADPDVWGQAVQTEVARAQLPAVLSVLEQGQTVRFADIAVNASGVSTPKHGSVTWDEIEKVSVVNGTVYLTKAGKRRAWSGQRVKTIPNFLLFMAVVDHLRAQRAAA